MINTEIKFFLMTSLRLILAACIIYLIIYLFQWENGYWAMISAAAIIRPENHHTYTKALMRIVGTLIGGILAYLLLFLANEHTAILIIGIFIISFLAGVLILQKTSLNYSGIIIGLTAIIIIADAQTDPNYFDVFLSRTALVLLGIISVFIISLLFEIILNKGKKIRYLCCFFILCDSWYSNNCITHWVCNCSLYYDI